MDEIKLKHWLIWAAILIALGFAADYYFLHILFPQKQELLHGAVTDQQPSPGAMAAATHMDSTLYGEAGTAAVVADSGKDNFNESLRACAPEIAAQAVATPEALMEYLRKSLGVKSETVLLENYHVDLPNGTKRRIHVIGDDNTNSKDKKIVKYYKLDAQDLPEEIPLGPEDTIEKLLSTGKVTRVEKKMELKLKDDSSASLEMHDNKIFQFQFNNHGKVLSCLYKECQCGQ
ncbi:hypothetical protein ACLVWU_05180 [Bdellovibrio sp. HCB290]|uniref:hypothetical protein n=1 Tax=Bdellovibrio sp. HCB290 TaxID=3394356 RepID=UPI0039B37B5C